MSSPSARLRSAMVSWRFAALLVVAVVTVLALAAPAFAIGNITGRVVDEWDQPVSNAAVTLSFEAGGSDIAFTNEFGEYTFFAVADGLHWIQTYSEYKGGDIIVAVTVSGGDVRHNFYQGLIAISGRVYDWYTYTPLDGCAVEGWYLNEMSGEYELALTVYTDSSGQYAFQQATAPGSDPLYLKFFPATTDYVPEMYSGVGLYDWDSAMPRSWTSMTPSYDNDAFLMPVAPVISGTVVDDMEGSPISWADVTLWYYDDASESYGIVTQTQTDDNGMYSFTNLDIVGYPKPYYVSFDSPGFSAELYSDVPMGDWGNAVDFSALPATEVDAALSLAPVAISGTVYNEDAGEPAFWPWVTAYQPSNFAPLAVVDEWWEVGWVESDWEGYYEIRDIEPGDTVVSASGEGLVPEFYQDVEFGDFTNAEKLPYNGEPISGIDFNLAEALPAIGGTVTSEDTGEPLEGVEIVVWQYDDMDMSWWQTDWGYTDEFGEYVLNETQVDGGPVRLEFDGSYAWPSSYYPEFYNDVLSIKDATSLNYTGAFIGGIDAALTPSAVGIEGTVTGSDTGSGLADVGVAAYYFDGDWMEWIESSWSTTDEEGHYALPDAQLEEIDYLIYFDARYMDYFSETYDGWTGFDTDNADMVTYAGTQISGIDAVLDPAPVAISGNVEDDDTGLAIEGVYVSAAMWVDDPMEETGWMEVAWSTTDADGNYSFTQADVEPGVDYAISFYGREVGYTSETFDNQLFLDFDNANLVQYAFDGSTSGINATLTALPEVVAGKITDSQTGLPLEGASAYLWKYFYFEEEGWGDWGIVDGVSTYADGMYTLKDEPDGSPYKVSAERPDYQPRMTGQFSYSGDTLTRDIALDPVGLVNRVAGSTRFSGSVVMARGQFDPDGDKSWPGVTHIVLASGEDRAAADPLAAAGLCGAYNAPLFLVSAGSVSNDVKAAVTEIAEANDTEIVVHIVGGLKSVPDARYNDLVAAVGSKGTLSKDRILSGGGRFDLSAAIARRIMEVNDGVPPVVLIANGMDSTKFFDALALSPIAARTGFPLLLVSQNAIPDATQDVLDEIWDHVGGGEQVIVGGGPNTVSDFVKNELGAVRWSGETRYTTAIAIADGAVDEGWLDRQNVGIAAKLPDALTGGATVGLKGGVLVLTDGAKLTPATRNWLSEYREEIVSCEVFGGTKSVLPSTHTAISNALLP